MPSHDPQAPSFRAEKLTLEVIAAERDGEGDLRERLAHAEAALAGRSEGARLWMLDCAEVAARNRQRAEAAESALTRVRELASEWAAKAPDDDWGDSMAGTVLADAGRAVLATMGDG